jgi:hypothetical protein
LASITRSQPPLSSVADAPTGAVEAFFHQQPLKLSSFIDFLIHQSLVLFRPYKEF